MKMETVNENVYIYIFTVNHEVFIRNLNHDLGQNFQEILKISDQFKK